MVKTISLKAESRSSKDTSVNVLRKSGFVPAVLYGSGNDPLSLKIKALSFDRAFSIAGESNLIDLIVDDKKPIKVLVKEIQKNPINDKIIHTDLYRIDMSKKIDVEIPINFIGESRAVKELGGTLLKNLDTIEVKCLPGDLLESIDVDISVLEEFNSSVKVGDLKLPSQFELLTREDNIITSVIEPKVEEEEPKVEEGEAEEGEEGAAEKSEDKKEDTDKPDDKKKSDEKNKKTK